MLILHRVRRSALVARSVRLFASGGGHHEDHHEPSPAYKAHFKEEWLKIAREWPKDPYAPPNNYEIETIVPAQSSTPSFFNSVLLRLVLLGAFGYGVYEINNYVTAGQELHPAGRILASFMKTNEELDAEQVASIEAIQRHADGRRIYMEKPPQKIHRIAFTGILDRASDRLIEPGTQIDISDVKFKHTWEEQ